MFGLILIVIIFSQACYHSAAIWSELQRCLRWYLLPGQQSQCHCAGGSLHGGRKQWFHNSKPDIYQQHHGKLIFDEMMDSDDDAHVDDNGEDEMEFG